MIKNDVVNFINESPTAFNAVDNLKKELVNNNFIELLEEEKFNLKKGNKYFITRNDSCIIAFKIGKDVNNDYSFKMVASHADSPCFKIKPNYNNKQDIYNRINIEPYGGMIVSTWLDRPLSIAGRIIIKQDNQIVSKIINIKKPILMIPNMCIHFNREINKGYEYNFARDMVPFIGQDDLGNDILSLVSEELNVNKEDVLNFDLFTYNFEKGYLWGKNDEYISSPRLDDLECAYVTMRAFIESGDNEKINICAVFDNEEVGSTTIQGANSDFLNIVLRRINNALNFDEETYYCALSKSF